VERDPLLFTVKADTEWWQLADTRWPRPIRTLKAKPFHSRGPVFRVSVAVTHGQFALGLLNFDPCTQMTPKFHTAVTTGNMDRPYWNVASSFAWALLHQIEAEQEDTPANSVRNRLNGGSGRPETTLAAYEINGNSQNGVLARPTAKRVAAPAADQFFLTVNLWSSQWSGKINW